MTFKWVGNTADNLIWIVKVMLQNAIQNMKRRINSCIQAGREHWTFSMIVNKTVLGTYFLVLHFY
jgi:hypothetical protein